VGRGGLVGSAIARRPELDVFDAVPVPWGTPDAPHVLDAELSRFVAWADGRPWAVVWAAGSGVMLTGEDVLDLEVATFRRFCASGEQVLPRGRGGVYLVSSAGGTYAGSQRPPFGLSTTPVPLNAYGRAKLAQEDALEELSGGHVDVTIGRLSNAYGPGQDLTKRQGLVTQLCLSMLMGRPATVFAPLETLRDFVYVDDAARIVADDVVAMASSDQVSCVRRIVCSGRSVSIAELIAMVEQVAGHPLPLVHLLAAGSDSPVDLRLRSDPDPRIERMLATPLETGVNLVWADLVDRLAAGRLSEIA
ncbi:NAD-dependent epimerase/dehydratase family protein, partial [Aeromicrobium endophyticum]